jgi:molecular chaperone GrpE (heat shock protein)
MACYFRHLQDIFKKAQIEVTKENKQELDNVIHRIVATKYKDCPAT